MRQVLALAAVLVLGGPAASAWAVTDKYNITPAEHAACDGDAAALCTEAYPDEDKLLACMKANMAQLTPVCRTTFVSGMKRRRML